MHTSPDCSTGGATSAPKPQPVTLRKNRKLNREFLAISSRIWHSGYDAGGHAQAIAKED
jgi:hypothetical protein